MLKKCIAFAVVFAVAAGAAFAQLTVGGQLQEGLTIISGNNVKDDDVSMGGKPTGDAPFHEAKISLLLGDGTAGGRLVMTAKGSYWGWMQWRPNQYFRVKIGSDGDGEWGFPQIAGWGFTGEAKISVGAVSDYNGSLAMRYRNAGLNYGAFDGAGDFNLGLSVFPVDDLQINLLFKNIDGDKEISERLATMHFIASYKLEEVGTIRFAAVGAGGLAKEAKDGTDIGTLWLAFYSNEIVQGLAFEVGGNYNLPRLNDGDIYNNINVALGVNLTSTDPFNLKIRTNVAFGGQRRIEKDQNNNDKKINEIVARDLGWGIGILPSYKLPKMTIFLHAGLGIENKVKNDWEKDHAEDELVYNWFINPYIWVPMGGMRMWVGVQILDAHAAQDGQINWNVPFGFNFYF
jgi:hypothetical protein